MKLFKKNKSKITPEHGLSALTGAQGTPLKNVKIGSGVTNIILDSIFDYDLSSYEAFFRGFVFGYYGEALFDRDKEVIDKIYGYAICRDKNNEPSSLDTIVKAQLLDGEIGAVVQNAIIYAIAMYISWEHQHPDVVDDVKYTTKLPNARQPDKTPEQLCDEMMTNNPRASVIAWALCAPLSKELASIVVGKMYYLLYTCEHDEEESEYDLSIRILDEQLD